MEYPQDQQNDDLTPLQMLFGIPLFMLAGYVTMVLFLSFQPY